MIFTNKHVISAMLVAPILAILGWYAVGEFIGEKPKAAARGASYPLLEMSNCRYDSGRCGLENEDFKLELVLNSGSTGTELRIESAHALDGVMVEVSAPHRDAAEPRAMRASDDSGQRWILALPSAPGADEHIRLVAGRDGSSWFGEATTRFSLGDPDDSGLGR